MAELNLYSVRRAYVSRYQVMLRLSCGGTCPIVLCYIEFLVSLPSTKLFQDRHIACFRVSYSISYLSSGRMFTQARCVTSIPHWLEAICCRQSMNPSVIHGCRESKKTSASSRYTCKPLHAGPRYAYKNSTHTSFILEKIWGPSSEQHNAGMTVRATFTAVPAGKGPHLESLLAIQLLLDTCMTLSSCRLEKFREGSI